MVLLQVTVQARRYEIWHCSSCKCNLAQLPTGTIVEHSVEVECGSLRLTKFLDVCIHWRCDLLRDPDIRFLSLVDITSYSNIAHISDWAGVWETYLLLWSRCRQFGSFREGKISWMYTESKGNILSFLQIRCQILIIRNSVTYKILHILNTVDRRPTTKYGHGRG